MLAVLSLLRLATHLKTLARLALLQRDLVLLLAQQLNMMSGLRFLILVSAYSSQPLGPRF